MPKIPLKKIFEYMYFKIGGEQNKDVKWYLHDRSKYITRRSFFKELVWAVWVARTGIWAVKLSNLTDG